MLRITIVKPCREIKKLASSAMSDLDFTNGIDWDHTKTGKQVVALLNEQCYKIQGNGLGLKGKGSVLPHRDQGCKYVAVWLVSATEECHLMIAANNHNNTLLDVGEIIVFDSSLLHSWVSRGRWSLIVQDVTKSRAK